MTAQLAKGDVQLLPDADLVVSLSNDQAVDLTALLLNSAAQVRGSVDLVFYNQPSGPGVQLAVGQPALLVRPAVLPADIDHVRIVASLVDENARFDTKVPPRLHITDDHGNPWYESVIHGMGGQTTVIVCDLDRGDQWRVRMQAHGYPAGFEELVKAHGVHVAGEMALDLYRGPAALDRGHDVPLQAVRHGELSLVKMCLGWDPVVVYGVRGPREVEIDLDASALVFAGREFVDVAYFGQLSSRDGAVRHSGDNLTGDGAGDDEVITVDLARLTPATTSVVFTVTSYAGHTFERVRNAFWRMLDGISYAELARGNLRIGGSHTGMVVAKVYRDGPLWRLTVIDAPMQAGHPYDALPIVDAYV